MKKIIFFLLICLNEANNQTEILNLVNATISYRRRGDRTDFLLVSRLNSSNVWVSIGLNYQDSLVNH